jgi:hypothetical protein
LYWHFCTSSFSFLSLCFAELAHRLAALNGLLCVGWGVLNSAENPFDLVDLRGLKLTRFGNCGWRLMPEAPPYELFGSMVYVFRDSRDMQDVAAE